MSMQRESATPPPPWSARRAMQALQRPVDIASLAAFRILFGLMMAAGTARFVASGWVETLYETPRFYFAYPGLEWWTPWGHTGLLLHFAVIGVSALFVAFGLYYRLSIVIFTLLFGSAQLWDVTNYLNHYYLVFLLGVLLCFLPAHRAVSVDAWRRPELRTATVPLGALALLRFQVGVVYFYAAVAKIGPDWLLHGQPLGMWLSARNELPLVGSLFDVSWVPLAMSWAGFLYDLTIPLWLSWRRSRPYAFVVVLGFHGMTSALFSIGMFPIIMTVGALLFFSPSWPRRILGRFDAMRWEAADRSQLPGRGRRWVVAVAGLYVAIQLLVPLRHFALPGDVLWGEAGMRWSWKVMVRSKKGSLTYRVRPVGSERREWEVSPLDYLEWRQLNEIASQPDLIASLARHIARDFENRGYGPVEVRADAKVSLNGRPPVLMLDPNVDLSEGEPDGFDWILPEPEAPPLRSNVSDRIAANVNEGHSSGDRK